MGWMGGDHAIDRLNMFRKSEEILKYLHEIEKYFTWEEKQVLDQAADVITSLMNRKMNNPDDIEEITSESAKGDSSNISDTESDE